MLALYREVSEPLGAFAESVWNSPAFYEKRWDNKSANVNVCRGEIAKKVRGIADDITNILESADESSPALIDRYLETLSLSGLADYSERLREISGMSDDFMSGASAAEEPLEEPIGYKVIKINGTAKRVRAMLDQLSMMGAGTRLVEDGMPRDPAPHALPDFDDFVAVDIETSGSLGTSLGDGRPEITEIGAVKVRGGKDHRQVLRALQPRKKHSPGRRGAHRHNRRDGGRQAAGQRGHAEIHGVRRKRHSRRSRYREL